jgi:hypothetical protein
MEQRLANLAFFNRNNKNLEAINQARTTARELLMDLLQLDAKNEGYNRARETYFAAVVKYAKLTDQTFESALASMF